MQSLPSVGSIIDDTYEIKSLLGKGGFGAVFLARHIPMEREVALKMLIAHGHNPQEMTQRFRREVMAIRNLSHPNTVRIFDYRDSTEDTLIYYTMEYLKGCTLKDVVRHEGPQAPKRLKHILKQILKSLAEAHSIGIVHRDLKPANIMLVEMYGEQDFVKVLDFGIAKLMEQEDDEDEPLTSAGMLVGTLRYMSPEQIKGDPLGPYTDIYALGLIALEMLMGKSVFAGTGRWEVLQQQVSPTSIAFPQEIHHSAIAPILQKMLSKDPAQRYPNAEALLRDLNSIPDNALEDFPLLAPSGSSSSGNSHSASSHSLLDAPSTPASASLEGTPTTISDINSIAQQHDQSRVPAYANTQGTYPQHATGNNTGGFPQRTTLPPLPNTATTGEFASNPEEFIFKPKKASKTPIIAAAGVLALLVIIGIVAVFITQTPSEPQPTVTPEPTTTETPSAQVETPPEVVEDTPPEPQEPALTQVKLQLDQDLQKVTATAYLGDEKLGTLPLDYEFNPDSPVTLLIKADSYEDQEVLLDQETKELVSVSLKKTPPPKKVVPKDKPKPKTKPKTTTKTKTEKTKDPDWADVTKPKTKKPSVPIFQ